MNMEQISGHVAAAVQTARSIVTGGFLIAVVLFAVMILLFILFYARSLGGRRRQHRDEGHGTPLDRTQVIGRFPRRATMADGTTKALHDFGTRIGKST
jgi:uncharacterized membrane protein